MAKGSTFQYKISGNIDLAYKNQICKAKNVKILILMGDGDITEGIQLTIDFDHESANKLVEFFQPMSAITEGFYSYAFNMKEDVIKNNEKFFNDAINLEDWLKAGEGILLKLENYTCEGYGKVE